MSTKSRKSTEGHRRKGAFGLSTFDHEKVEELFSEFDDLKECGSDEEKSAVVERICNELQITAAILRRAVLAGCAQGNPGREYNA